MLKLVGNDVIELFEKVKEDYFPELNEARFKLFFRDTRKGKEDALSFAEIFPSNMITRVLTEELDNVEDGVDYFIILDENIFNLLDETDKIRVLRSQMRHCDVNVEREERRAQFLLRDFTVKDFHEDIEIEKKDGGDLYWKSRVRETGNSFYEELAEKQKEEKKAKRKKKKD